MKIYLKRFVVSVITAEAKWLLSRHQPKIIAITGSVGKTTTKDAIYAVLKSHHQARKSEKSFNSELGVPLTVLGLPNGWSNPFSWLKNIVEGFLIAAFSRDYPKVLVLETGVDRPGDMAALTSWIKPDVVVLTRLPTIPVHVEFFSSPEAVVKEKMELVRALKPEGTLVYNHDDELINREVAKVRQTAIGYSRYSPSQYQITADNTDYHGDLPVGTSFNITHLETSAKIEIKGTLGIQQAYNSAAACAVGSVFGVDLQSAAAALSDYDPPPGRMRIIKGLKDSLIIDDSYNSSPVAAERALMTLKEIKGAKRKIAILGDMLELGQYSSREHEALGAEVAKSADFLVTLGIRSRKIAEGALEHGLSEKNILQYDDLKRACNEVQALLKPGDCVLVKASQGIRAEKLIEEIMAEPERAPELLVRQDQTWQRKM